MRFLTMPGGRLTSRLARFTHGQMHLFVKNFDHDYFFGLPLPRERDAPSI